MEKKIYSCPSVNLIAVFDDVLTVSGQKDGEALVADFKDLFQIQKL